MMRPATTADGEERATDTARPTTARPDGRRRTTDTHTPTAAGGRRHRRAVDGEMQRATADGEALSRGRPTTTPTLRREADLLVHEVDDEPLGGVLGDRIEPRVAGDLVDRVRHDRLQELVRDALAARVEKVVLNDRDDSSLLTVTLTAIMMRNLNSFMGPT